MRKLLIAKWKRGERGGDVLGQGRRKYLLSAFRTAYKDDMADESMMKC